jgi:hypothetical protein
MEWLALVIQNWDTVTLIVTNIAALFVKPPIKRTKRTRAGDLK